MTDLSFPPLFKGLSAEGQDPFTLACQCAKEGCDAGLVTYDLRPDTIQAALVFAPEVALRDAMIMLPLCGIGFQNALGALAPPEVGVHLEWAGGIRVNGGVAGNLKIAASSAVPEEEPDWLVIGLTLALWPDNAETGLNPDVTALFSEGCADVEAPALLEAWVRHTLVWVNQWLEDGPRGIHETWSGLLHGLKTTTTVVDQSGEFIGVDENFGMVLKMDTGTIIIPLTDILTEAT